MYLEKIAMYSERKKGEEDFKDVIPSLSFVNRDDSRVKKYHLPLPIDRAYLSETMVVHEQVLKVISALRGKGFGNVEVIEKKVYEELEDRKLEIRATGKGLELK